MLVSFGLVCLLFSASVGAGRVTSARPKSVGGELTALDEYVWKYDENYDWVEMVSQDKDKDKDI